MAKGEDNRSASELLQAIDELWESAKANFEKFDEKGVKKAATDTRNDVGSMAKLLVPFRKAILEEKKAMPINQKYSHGKKKSEAKEADDEDESDNEEQVEEVEDNESDVEIVNDDSDDDEEEIEIAAPVSKKTRATKKTAAKKPVTKKVENTKKTQAKKTKGKKK